MDLQEEVDVNIPAHKFQVARLRESREDAKPVTAYMPRHGGSPDPKGPVRGRKIIRKSVKKRTKMSPPQHGFIEKPNIKFQTGSNFYPKSKKIVITEQRQYGRRMSRPGDKRSETDSDVGADEYISIPAVPKQICKRGPQYELAGDKILRERNTVYGMGFLQKGPVEPPAHGLYGGQPVKTEPRRHTQAKKRNLSENHAELRGQGSPTEYPVGRLGRLHANQLPNIQAQTKSDILQRQRQLLKNRPSTSSVHFLRDQAGRGKKQIRIEISRDTMKQNLLDPEHRESMSLLFYDFNRQGTRVGEEARRPTTSHFTVSDRLPSRQVKTRSGKRMSIMSRRNKTRGGEQRKQAHVSASPQNHPAIANSGKNSFKPSPRSKRKITTAKATHQRLGFEPPGGFTQGQNLANYFPSEFGAHVGGGQPRFPRQLSKQDAVGRKKSPLILQQAPGCPSGRFDFTHKAIKEEAQEYEF